MWLGLIIVCKAPEFKLRVSMPVSTAAHARLLTQWGAAPARDHACCGPEMRWHGYC